MSILKHITGPLIHNGKPLIYNVPAGATYPTANLVARFAFEDDILDSGGNGYDMTYVGDPNGGSFASGQIGQCYQTNKTDFNDSVPKSTLINDSDASLYNFAAGAQEFTIVQWLRLTNASADIQGGVATYSGGTARMVFPYFGGASWKPSGGVNGCLTMAPWGNPLLSNVDYRDSNWHMFVLTKSGTTGKVYVDNSLVASPTASDIGSGSNIQIGSTNGSWIINGEIDNTYLYNKALDTTEISQLWNGGSGV